MNVRIQYNMPFTAGIYYGDKMQMNHYTVTLHMTTNSNDSVSHNVAFERIKYFVYSQLESSIFINQDHHEQCERFVDAGLNITTMPGEPVDQLIGLMLYYKLNAIMEDRIIVDETELSSILGENMIYLHCEHENTDLKLIPDWWTSAEPTNSDFLSGEAEKILSIQPNTVWRELQLSWPETIHNDDTGNIVVFADFKSDNETK